MRRLVRLFLAMFVGCNPPSTLSLTEHGVLLPRSNRYSPLMEGVRVRVTTCSGEEMEGRWVHMGYRHGVLRTPKGDRRIPWKDVVRIRVTDDNDRDLAIPVVHALSPFRATLIGLVLSAPFLDFQDPLIAWVGPPPMWDSWSIWAMSCGSARTIGEMIATGWFGTPASPSGKRGEGLTRKLPPRPRRRRRGPLTPVSFEGGESVKGHLWMVAVFLAACSTPLVRHTSPDRPRWDVPYGKPFPEGTRGMAVVRDTLWVGDLQALPDGIRLAGRTFRLEEVDCLSYRLPANYFPWQIGLQALVLVVAGSALVINALQTNCTCDPETILFCPLAVMFCAMVTMTEAGAGLSLTLSGGIYPRLRLREHLYRYTLHRDPLWQERCAAVLHFYEPLLAEDTLTLLLRQGRIWKAIPLDF